jgi:putative ABC transport system permease protein
MGANAIDVLKVLSSDFFMLLAVSAVMAVGFGLWFSRLWLEGFAYKTNISSAIYLLSILLVTVIALLTIGYRTFKVFALNPAKTLKDE